MKTALVGVAALLLAVSTASADVRVTMHDGRVSVIAKDATVRQILTEWARVGHTKIVNMERVPGGPVTLDLVDVPEAQALDILLRAISGYIAAPRAVEGAGLSRFDRIIVMPTLAAARPTTTAPLPPPVFQHAPQFNNQQTPDDEEEGGRPVTNAPPPPARGPVFNTFPQPQGTVPPQVQQQPQMVQPGAPAMPQAAPGMPTASPTPTAPFGGVAVPGMVAPPPPQPNGAPGQVRRPGVPGGL